MKEKIEEVQSYFKNKLLTGNFEITSITEYWCEVIIDNQYKFTVWIGNMNLPQYFRLYESSYNFMQMDFTAPESEKLYTIIKPQVIKQLKETIIAKKREELENLIKESESE